MGEVETILDILRESKQAFQSNDSYRLKVLSDKAVSTAAVYQDAENVVLAVVVYSLAKIIEREGYRRMEGWEQVYQSIIKNLDSAIKYAERNRPLELLEALGEVRNVINLIEGDLSNYIKDIFYKAGINKAFKLYEHGLSAEKTASMLGVSLWDLGGYIGQSTISESHFNEAIPVKERIKLAESFFK